MPVSKTKVVAAKPEKDVFFFKRREVEWKKAGLYIVLFFFLSLLLHKNYLFAQEITLQKEYAWRAEGSAGWEKMVKSRMMKEGDVDQSQRDRHLHLQGMAPKETVSSVTSGSHSVLSVSCFYIQFFLPMAREDQPDQWGNKKVISQVQYDCLISTLFF